MLAQYMEKENVVPGRVVSLEAINAQLDMSDQRLQRFDELAAAMESADEIIDDLDSLLSSGHANQTTAVMMRERITRLEDATGLVAAIPSMEDHGDDMDAYHQISMEAISGIWNRLKQAYVAEFQMYVDALATLFHGYRREGQRQMGRIHKLRQEWANRKPDLHEKTHKSSAAGVAVYRVMVVNGALTKDPVGMLTTDYKYASYMCDTYQRDLASYFGKVQGVLKGGKYDSDDGFRTSVVAKLAALPHPSTILKLDIIGKGSELIGNNGLEMARGRPQKPVNDAPEYKKLADLCVQTYVKEFIFTWTKLNGHVLPDIHLSTADVDKLLDLSESYSKLLVNAATSFKPMTRAIQELASFSKRNIQVDGLSEVNRKAFRQVIGFVRGLARYSKTPYRVEIERVRKVAQGSRILASRTIATAK